MSDTNAFVDWLQGNSKPPAVSGIQHPLQLSGSTAQSTLVPVQTRTAQEFQGKVYLPQPGAYIGPQNHSRLMTNQTPQQQPPNTISPTIGSAYLLPPKGL